VRGSKYEPERRTISKLRTVERERADRHPIARSQLRGRTDSRLSFVWRHNTFPTTGRWRFRPTHHLHRESIRWGRTQSSGHRGEGVVDSIVISEKMRQFPDLESCSLDQIYFNMFNNLSAEN